MICTEVLEHVLDPTEILKDMYDVTKHKVLLTTGVHDYKFTLSYLLPEGGHIAIHSKKSLATAAEKVGFNVKLIDFPGQNEYFYILLSK